MCLDPGLLLRMAEQGTALTPTLSVITASLAGVRSRPDSPRKDWYVAGASAHGRLTAAAVEAGVTVLAGTDSRPHGRVVDEIRAWSTPACHRTRRWRRRRGVPGRTSASPA
jgi:hypothetical protein